MFSIKNICTALIIIGLTTSTLPAMILAKGDSDESIFFGGQCNSDVGVDLFGLLPDQKSFIQWLEAVKQSGASEFLSDVAGVVILSSILHNGLILMHPEAYSDDSDDLMVIKEVILSLIGFRRHGES